MSNNAESKSVRAYVILGLFLFCAGFVVFNVTPFFESYTLSNRSIELSAQKVPMADLEKLAPLQGKYYMSRIEFLSEIDAVLNESGQYSAYNQREYYFWIAKYAARGWHLENRWLYILISLGLLLFGALVYYYPRTKWLPGIKHDGIYFAGHSARGFAGIVLGIYLIGFYILLYWYPQYITGMVSVVDPISELLRQQPADRWFMYGLLYTLAVAVMGIRMFLKYRHSKYHQIRTASVIFFQTGFAFLLPTLMERLGQPSMDLKNAWPLNYTFFTDWHLDSLTSGGGFGLFLMTWGVILAIVVVPFLTYRYGKRWYCSWVCGCGGLAETLGDPFRQLSDKSLKSWRLERWSVHGVLVLAVIMTIMQIANYSSGGAIFASYTWRVNDWYSFLIGSAFAGVVGTGFYPFMGNRVWCRFGCPLAAILGIVQRFKSRFVISTNGGQCISCGNCSTYCEMGIDVRWYAQRGQNIVRASCVGCGVCSAVCPRGVLRLENVEPGQRFNIPADDKILNDFS